MNLVCQKAPDFTAKAVLFNNNVEDFHLAREMDGKMFILFFYPLDFTFVCPSEIIAFNNKLNEFKSRNCEVIGVSVDSHFSHIAWKNTPINKGGIGNIQYTLISDLSKQISRQYGVLLNEEVSLRGTFLIDKNFIVRHQVINDLPLGRSIDEAIRMVDTLIHFEENGEVCPAGWKKGQDGMKPNAEGVSEYLTKHSGDL